VAAHGSKRIGSGAAALAGWLVLAALNQLLVTTNDAPAPLGTRAVHRLYDAGQLVLAGVASFGAVELARRVFARYPRFDRAWAHALALGFAAFVVSLLTLENDVTNAAGRYAVPVGLALLVASAGVACVLGATVLVRALRSRRQRVALTGIGVALGVANAFVLANDYPGVHLALAWLAALLVAHGVDGTLPSPGVGAVGRRLALAMLATFGVLAVAVPPPQGVRKRLIELPSAVLAPFALRLLPDTSAAELARVPEALRRSPWFRDRRRLASVPPTRALVLPESPLVLFLTVDAMRADVLSEPRSLRELRAFAALKKRSAYFSAARAPASSTRPSMAATFTGRYANQLRWSKREGSTFLVDPGPRLAELLSAAGVATVSLPLLQRIGSESGVGRGFQREIRKDFAAKELVDHIIELTNRLEGPTFLYAHFGEPHAPYQGDGTPRQRYLQEVTRVDRQLRRLLRHLDQSGLSARTLLVISADHGEAFGEHGVGNHATIVYEEVARIPLLVRGPGVVARELDVPVSLLDVTPTILDVFGLPAPGAFMGQSLAPLLAGQNVELERPIAICSAGSLDALYVPGSSKKVIFDGARRTIEVYDLARDAQERRNLVDTSEPQVEQAIEIAKLFFETHAWRRRERVSD
jgi:hypothetical protein